MSEGNFLGQFGWVYSQPMLMEVEGDLVVLYLKKIHSFSKKVIFSLNGFLLHWPLLIVASTVATDVIKKIKNLLLFPNY